MGLRKQLLIVQGWHLKLTNFPHCSQKISKLHLRSIKLNDAHLLFIFWIILYFVIGRCFYCSGFLDNISSVSNMIFFRQMSWLFFFPYQSVLLWTGLYFPVDEIGCCQAAIMLSARHSSTWKNKLCMIVFIQTLFDTHFTCWCRRVILKTKLCIPYLLIGMAGTRLPQGIKTFNGDHDM